MAKKCYNKSPSYYMAMFNTTDCAYLSEPGGNSTLYTPLVLTNGTRGIIMTMSDVRETGMSAKVSLICARGVSKLTLYSKYFDPISQTFFMTYGAEGACPGEIYNVIWANLSSLSWVFLLIGLVVGPLELFLGYKLFRITIFVVD